MLPDREFPDFICFRDGFLGDVGFVLSSALKNWATRPFSQEGLSLNTWWLVDVRSEYLGHSK